MRPGEVLTDSGSSVSVMDRSPSRQKLVTELLEFLNDFNLKPNKGKQKNWSNRLPQFIQFVENLKQPVFCDRCGTETVQDGTLTKKIQDFDKRLRELETYYQHQLAETEVCMAQPAPGKHQEKEEIRILRRKLRTAEKLVSTMLFKLNCQEEEQLIKILGEHPVDQNVGSELSFDQKVRLAEPPRTDLKTKVGPERQILYFTWPDPRTRTPSQPRSAPSYRQRNDFWQDSNVASIIQENQRLRAEILKTRQEKEDVLQMLRGTYVSKEFYKRVIKLTGNIWETDLDDRHLLTFDPSFPLLARHMDCVGSCCLPILGMDDKDGKLKSERLKNLQEIFHQDMLKLKSEVEAKKENLPSKTAPGPEQVKPKIFSPMPQQVDRVASLALLQMLQQQSNQLTMGLPLRHMPMLPTYATPVTVVPFHVNSQSNYDHIFLPPSLPPRNQHRSMMAAGASQLRVQARDRMGSTGSASPLSRSSANTTTDDLGDEDCSVVIGELDNNYASCIKRAIKKLEEDRKYMY